MIKRPTVFFLLLISSPLLASDGYTHNMDLMRVILGRPFVQNENEQTKIEILQKAVYLAIDQFNGANLTYLDDLRNFGVKDIPNSNEIDFTAGGEHQRYTHRGWDFLTYPVNIRGYNFQEIWEKRKLVLLSTLDRMFSFKRNEMIKVDSLGAIIYYTHILRDHNADAKSTYTDRIPISPRPDYRFNRSGPNSNNPTIYTELLYHLPRLFREQLDAVEYRMLLSYLTVRRSREFSTGTTIPDEEYEQLQAFALETLEVLCQFVPILLRNESFFKRVF
jgi:hypothetical protein